MRLHRPVLLGLALGAILPVTAASAASGVAAAGAATSSATVSVGSLTLAGTTIKGHTIQVGTLSAAAQSLTSAAPSVTFTPVTVDGTKTGSVTVTPSNSPLTVGGVSTGALPLNVLSATSPAATLKAAQAAASRTANLTAGLGSISILGLPVTVNGGLNVGSVTDAAHAQAGKTLSITNVKLPSLAALLAALGIDISKLPVATLNGLVTDLPVTLSNATKAALTAANSAITSAATAKATAQATYDAASADAAAKLAAFATALQNATYPALPPGYTAPLTPATWNDLGNSTGGDLVQQTILTTNPAVDTALTAYDTAATALATADTALTNAIDTLAGAINTLVNIVQGVLGATPLAEIGAAEVGTKAAVGTAKSAAVTGYVSGVKVMGEDVLATLTGNTKIDAAKLVGSAADEVNAEIASITGSLSDVLSTATGAAGLTVPAPSIQVLTKQTKTGTDGAFGTASAVVSALSVTLGSLTIPQNYALSDAASKAGIGATATGFKTAPLSVKVGTLAEAARFRPASTTGTTPGGSGSMPSTGAPFGLAILAVAGAAGAVIVRRRLRSEH